VSTVFIDGKRIILSPLDERFHLDMCYRWFNDQDVIRYLLTDCVPTTYTSEKKWFEELHSNDRLMFAIETVDQRKYIGNVGLHHIDWISRTARTVTILGDKTEWGKGFGTEAKRLVISYAFKTLNLRKLSTHTLECNIPSKRMNVKCGFKEAGRLQKEVYREGQYHDLIIMDLMQNDWESERTE
jgi:RimJ/RimL family protein N-acetyltransferase